MVHQTSSSVSTAVPQKNHINITYVTCTIHTHAEKNRIEYRRAGTAVTLALPLFIICATF